MGDGSVDKTTKAMVGMDIDHNKVHTKQLLYAYKNDILLTDDTALSFYIKTDVDYESHLRIFIACDAKSELIIKKDTVAPTSPTGPNIVYLRKYLKNATVAAKTKLYDSITGGTFQEVFKLILPGGSGNFAVGGQKSSAQEMVLEENSWYFIEYYNRGASSEATTIHLSWYEINEHAEEGEDRENPDLKIL